jgi:hypothetical protein
VHVGRAAAGVPRGHEARRSAGPLGNGRCHGGRCFGGRGRGAGGCSAAHSEDGCREAERESEQGTLHESLQGTVDDTLVW